MNLKDLTKPAAPLPLKEPIPLAEFLEAVEDAEFEEESDLYEALRLLDDCRDIFDHIARANRIRLGGYLIERLTKLDTEVQMFLDQWDSAHMGGGEI